MQQMRAKSAEQSGPQLFWSRHRGKSRFKPARNPTYKDSGFARPYDTKQPTLKGCKSHMTQRITTCASGLSRD